jgi:hypothetical protein
MKVSIGKLSFKSKQESYEFTKKFIYNLGPCVIGKNHEHFGFFMDLIEPAKYPPESIESFEILKYPGCGKTLHLQVSTIDIKHKSISWVDCSRRLLKIDSHKTMLISAMRRAIQTHIDQFRNDNPFICKLCECSSENIQVDHIEPFDALYKLFILENTPPDTFAKNEYGMWLFQEKDKEYSEKWITYHEKNAKFQMLCRECNIFKSNKINYHTIYQRQDKVKEKRKVYLKHIRIEKLEEKLLKLTL